MLRTATDVCNKKMVGGYVKKGSEWWDDEVRIEVEKDGELLKRGWVTGMPEHTVQ